MKRKHIFHAKTQCSATTILSAPRILRYDLSIVNVRRLVHPGAVTADKVRPRSGPHLCLHASGGTHERRIDRGLPVRGRFVARVSCSTDRGRDRDLLAAAASVAVERKSQTGGDYFGTNADRRDALWGLQLWRPQLAVPALAADRARQ